MKTADTPIPAFHRATIAVQIEASLAALLTAEQAAVDAAANLLIAQAALVKAEDRVLLAEPPLLDGKNEAIRATHLRSLTTFAREGVAGAEFEHLKARSALEGARATFAAAKALARLLAGNGE